MKNNKFFKKFAATFLAVAILLASAPLSGFAGLDFLDLFNISASAQEYSGTCGENLTWTFNEATGELRIEGTGAMDDYAEAAEAPWCPYEVKKILIGNGVTSIGTFAFHYAEYVTDVVISDSVVSIGDHAFHGCAFKNMSIGNGVTTIGEGAFADTCYREDSEPLVIPDSVRTVGERAFAYSYLANTDFLKNLTTISFCMFEECYFSENSITIPGNIKVIESRAFDYSNIDFFRLEDGVSYLADSAFGFGPETTFVIPKSVSFIGSGAFYEYYGSCSATIYYEGTEDEWYNTLSDPHCEYTALYCLGENASGKCGDDVNWKIDTETDSLVISGSGQITDEWGFSPYFANVVIEDGVTSIGSDAFRNFTSLTSITIPDSVTSIGDFAFWYCTSLTSVTNSKSITSIGNYAFSDCESLTSITIPDSVTSIGNYAFRYCSSLTSITIPDGVRTIDAGTFSCCKSLTSITIPDSVTSIGDNAFEYCTSLTSITIPDSVTSIGSKAFYNCTSLTSITIPNRVKSIGKSAFENCKSLTNITIPDSVTSISSSAFSGCSGIESIIIPDSVTSIGNYAFSGCTGLTNITVSKDNAVYSSDEYGVLFNKDKTELILYPADNKRTRYTIPDSVTSIDSYAFSGCTSLASITIPDSVTSINSSAFRDCTSLTSITIPDSVTSIGNYAFYGCTNLTNITVPNTVTIIDYFAFYGCTSLISITIPDSVTSIGNNAFENCESLTSITIGNSVTSISSKAFSGCTSLASITIPDSVTSIDDNAFRDCSSLTSITIPDSVTRIGSSAFYNCESLTSITIPDSVTHIDYSMFYNCRRLTSITIPSSVTSIGSSAFYNCDSLTSITIPDSVTSIGSSVFYYCDNLTSNTIPDSVTSIDSYAFYCCKSLTSITIPDSVTSIGYSAFESCNSLTDVYYNGTEDGWNEIKIRSYNADLLNATIHFAESEHEHSYTSEITTQPTCTAEGVETFTCECGDSYTKAIPAKGHTLSHITVDSTCKVAGMEYDLCSECEVVLNSNTLPLKDHTWGEWTVTAEPTTENEGSKTRTCSVCSEEETESIPKLEVIVNEETGIEIVFGEEYGDGVEVQASEVYDGKSFQLVEANYGNVKTTIFDISTTVDGVAVQPAGKVKVRIPLPEGFEAGKIVVCYVDSENGKVTSIPAKVVDGYVEFETDHFSYYALLATKGKVHSVKIDDIRINYKDTMIIRPEIYADDGVRYTVTYSASNPSVAQVNQNGKITATAFGRTTITCTVTDEYGNTVTEKFTVNVRYTFWQWIIMLFLFGELWY